MCPNCAQLQRTLGYSSALQRTWPSDSSLSVASSYAYLHGLWARTENPVLFSLAGDGMWIPAGHRDHAAGGRRFPVGPLLQHRYDDDDCTGSPGSSRERKEIAIIDAEGTIGRRHPAAGLTTAATTLLGNPNLSRGDQLHDHVACSHVGIVARSSTRSRRSAPSRPFGEQVRSSRTFGSRESETEGNLRGEDGHSGRTRRHEF